MTDALFDPKALAPLAERLKLADPDRFLALLAAPKAARAALLVLYAFNVELARAPWVTREPLLARIRLQFWREVVTDPIHPRAHEVAEPLAALIRNTALPVALFERMISAREAEAEGHHLRDLAQLRSYLTDSAGALMALAVRALGAAASAEAVAQAYGFAQGVANYCLAIPAIEAKGRKALPPEGRSALATLAAEAFAELQAARRARRLVSPAARPALLAAWRAPVLLARAAADPGAIWSGRFSESEFLRRARLLRAMLLGF